MISLIIWLAVGLVAGILAKMLTPQKESSGYLSSMIVGLIGSVVGGWLAGILGLGSIFGSGILGELIIATGGAFLVLWIYHKFLADKMNLKV
ncbi:MAG TPA: GlsB/YeaQ/YmgE family stress response membrane protein [Saprospiraceae bacterium]|nr:GlsB/YeaQ/YmgE family stress response membrane protein [Saprospiraceae bacterium]